MFQLQKKCKKLFSCLVCESKSEIMLNMMFFALHFNVYVGMGDGINVFMLIGRPSAAIVLHDVEGSCNVAVAVVAA